MANISRNYVTFVKSNIFDYLRVIMSKYFDKDIANGFISKYINVRYYNIEENKYDNLARNIDYHLRIHLDLLCEDNKNIEIKKITYLLFKYILYFDDVLYYRSIDDILSELEEFRSSKLNLYDENFIKDLLIDIKTNNKRKESYLDAFKSDKFNIRFDKTNNKNVFMSSLEYNFNFPKIYSSYSKNKVFNSGIINEDKLMILYNMVNLEVLRNVINGNYLSQYIVDFPVSIFSKVEKINRLLDIIDDNVCKDNVILLINYSDYLDNKDSVDDLIKKGSRFCIYLDSSFEYSEEQIIWLSIFSYVLIDRDNKYNFDDSKLNIVFK